MRPIYHIAQDIVDEWKNPSPYALPYLEALLCLEDKDDFYGADDAKGIILYFLSNATGFRGTRARELKLELKEHL